MSPLGTANRLGHSRSIKALLKSRANINYSDYKGDRESALARSAT